MYSDHRRFSYFRADTLSLTAIINNLFIGGQKMLPLESTRSAHNALEKVHYTHDAMIDIVIAKPDVSQNTLAEYFGYSVGWISRIFCSDAFQARLAARRGEVITPGLLSTFEERLKLLATTSMDLLMEKLEDTENKPDIGTVFKALEISTKSLGYGARQTNVAIQNNLTVNNMSDQQLMEIAQGVG
jgi:hypothetical protein